MYIDAFIAIFGSVLVFLCAKQIADFAGEYVGTSFLRDANNPLTYRIVAVISVIFTIAGLFLR